MTGGGGEGSGDSILRGLSVLYVEDDAAVRGQLAQILGRRVGTLHLAGDGVEGLACFEAQRPQLVITDILMPRMDGLEMAVRIRALAPETPIVVTTAFNETDYFLRAIDTGIDKYVIKPIDTRLLLRALEHCARALLHEVERGLSTAVFEHSPVAILVSDRNNRIVSVNPAFTEITGYPRAEVIGRNPALLGSGRHDREHYARMWRTLREAGQWSGEIWNRRRNGETYPEWLSISTVKNGRGEITHHVGIFSDITERKAVEERMHRLAHHDALTGLPNRALFHDRLQQALIQAQRGGEDVAVMFLDLDRFKNINDTLGHGVGDQLLKGVAERLAACVRLEDTVCRLGGDEFVILLPRIPRPGGAACVAQKILDALERPFLLDGHELHAGASIGISFYPADGISADVLMQNADSAMYRAKELGRGNYQFYRREMNACSLERLALETHLRRAIERRELELHYQPLIDGHLGGIVGAEALVRWNHPEQGQIGPDRFIPLAEESGLILSIGEWVLREACRQAGSWPTVAGRPLRLAVNLSVRQLRQPELTGNVRRILAETGFDPARLELEVTESMLMHQLDESIAVLDALRALGIRIAIDDFGTGYSSLAYLRHLPIDTLKIDRSFVAGVTCSRDDAAIVDTIIALARNLQLRVVAEGVESAEQASFLAGHRCDEMQGYRFGRPQPAAAFRRLLDAAPDGAATPPG